jgi:hypothetical protein
MYSSLVGVVLFDATRDAFEARTVKRDDDHKHYTCRVPHKLGVLRIPSGRRVRVPPRMV